MTAPKCTQYPYIQQGMNISDENIRKTEIGPNSNCNSCVDLSKVHVVLMQLSNQD